MAGAPGESGGALSELARVVASGDDWLRSQQVHVGAAQAVLDGRRGDYEQLTAEVQGEQAEALAAAERLAKFGPDGDQTEYYPEDVLAAIAYVVTGGGDDQKLEVADRIRQSFAGLLNEACRPSSSEVGREHALPVLLVGRNQIVQAGSIEETGVVAGQITGGDSDVRLATGRRGVITYFSMENVSYLNATGKWVAGENGQSTSTVAARSNVFEAVLPRVYGSAEELGSLDNLSTKLDETTGIQIFYGESAVAKGLGLLYKQAKHKEAENKKTKNPDREAKKLEEASFAILAAGLMAGVKLNQILPEDLHDGERAVTLNGLIDFFSSNVSKHIGGALKKRKDNKAEGIEDNELAEAPLFASKEFAEKLGLSETQFKRIVMKGLGDYPRLIRSDSRYEPDSQGDARLLQKEAEQLGNDVLAKYGLSSFESEDFKMLDWLLLREISGRLGNLMGFKLLFALAQLGLIKRGIKDFDDYNIK